MYEAKDGIPAAHLFWILLFQASFCWVHSSTATYVCIIENKLCTGLGQFDNHCLLGRSWKDGKVHGFL